MGLILKRSIVLLLLLTLSGCFRQAGESLEPITNPTPAPQQSTTSGITQPNTNALTDFPATPTFPPVTVIQPPTSAGPGEDSTQALLPPSSPTAGSPIIVPSPTPAFITPISPGGPVVIDTATPTPVIESSATPSGLITPTALSANEAGPCTYTVKSGDNLFRIAVNHNVTLEDLRAANPDVIGDLIQPGQALQIPNCDAALSGIPTPSTDSGATASAPGNARIHVVQPGETLLAIARQYGVTVDELVRANNLADPNRLAVGQQLIIP